MLRNTIRTLAALSCLGTALSAQASDYTVTLLQTQALEYAAGAPLRVTFVVKNDSNVHETRTSWASLRYSSDIVFSGDDLKLGEYAIPPLQAGMSQQFVADLRLPWSIESGTASLVLRVDSANEIPEAIEINNDQFLTKKARAWFGTPRLEYRPVLEQVAGLESASVSTQNGTRLRIALVAPDKNKHWYLLRMSGSRSFVIDSWTVFGLELLNTAFQPRWFAQMNGPQAYPDYWMPRGVPYTGTLQIYVSALFIDPGFHGWSGDTANSIGLRIQP